MKKVFITCRKDPRRALPVHCASPHHTGVILSVARAQMHINWSNLGWTREVKRQRDSAVWWCWQRNTERHCREGERTEESEVSRDSAEFTIRCLSQKRKLPMLIAAVGQMSLHCLLSVASSEKRRCVVIFTLTKRRPAIDLWRHCNLIELLFSIDWSSSERGSGEQIKERKFLHSCVVCCH